MGFILIPLMHFGLTMIPRFGGPLEVYNADTSANSGEGFTGVMTSLKQLAKGQQIKGQDR